MDGPWEKEAFKKFRDSIDIRKTIKQYCKKHNIICGNITEKNKSQKLNYFIKEYQKEGINYVISTDIAKDGMLQGPSIELYKQILTSSKGVKLIASGGVSSIDDLKELKTIGCDAAIVGKAIYEAKFSLKELRELC